MSASHGFRDSLKDLELFLSCFLDFHDGGKIVASVAIVGGTPNSH